MDMLVHQLDIKIKIKLLVGFKDSLIFLFNFIWQIMYTDV